MAKKRCTLPIILLTLTQGAFATTVKKHMRTHGLTESTINRVLNKNQVISDTKMETSKKNKSKTQNLSFFVVGLHPRSCSKALLKIGNYEEYKNYLSFVTQSEYNDKTQTIYLKFDSTFLPDTFTLFFKIPRLNKPGSYPFSFPHGFLRDLKGEIFILNKANKCLFHMKGHWQGPHTGYSDLVFEVFSSTVLKLGLEKLIRISK